MERHDLIKEFPEFQEKIADLKLHDTHFRKLFDAYDETVHKVYNINNGTENVIDEYAHEVKARLLQLKDEIYNYLSNN